MCQPSQAVSPYCNALRKNRQSLPFNAMHRSRKALDKNCQHGLVERTIKKLRFVARNGKVRLARGKGGKLIPLSEPITKKVSLPFHAISLAQDVFGAVQALFMRTSPDKIIERIAACVLDQPCRGDVAENAA
jgi:hypothetical protein